MAYHVTCGFYSGLEMKTTNDTGNSLIYEVRCGVMCGHLVGVGVGVGVCGRYIHT